MASEPCRLGVSYGRLSRQAGGQFVTDCNREPLLFSSINRRQIVADFAGGTLTSDAGGLLLREVDRRIGLMRRLSDALNDPRDPVYITHEQHTLLAQRIFGIATLPMHLGRPLTLSIR